MIATATATEAAAAAAVPPTPTATAAEAAAATPWWCADVCGGIIRGGKEDQKRAVALRFQG